MAVNGFEVFDGDGHVLENDEEIASYFEGDFANLQRFKTFGMWPSLDGWARGFIMASNEGEPRRYTHTDAKVWGEMLEIIGAKGTVLYPTAGLAAGLISDPKWAVETIKAYNNWLEDRYTPKDERLYGAGIVPVQDPEAAAIEIARCATERVRFPAMMLPSQTYLGKTYGYEFFWPIFDAAEKHNMPLAIHGGPSRGMGFDHFREFVKVHTLEHPFPLMIQLTDIVFSGVWDAFPQAQDRVSRRGCYLGAVHDGPPGLRIRFRVRHAASRQKLKKRPSDYLARGRQFLGRDGTGRGEPEIHDRRHQPRPDPLCVGLSA
jgi:predicted TIM-barrel fold metal-dependent hydrolase